MSAISETRVLQPPAARDWSDRGRWVTTLIDGSTNGGGLNLSPQADALFVEAVRCFCAGSWPSVIILAQSTIDAELEADTGRDGLWLNEVRFGSDFGQLRNRRNALVHADTGQPVLTLHDLLQDQEALETEAKGAMGLVVEAFSHG